MVLGILSVMVIMAVAFAISMRTERVAAGNYADSVRARQLVQVGLARALYRLVDPVVGDSLGTNGLSSSGSKVYPDWLAPVVASSDITYTNTSKNVYLVYATNGSTRANEATNFVPRALWAAATNTDEIAASNHWVLIVSPGNSNIIGRVKYLVLNCSGLLDANFVGGDATRGVGTNPSELAIGSMPEFKLNGANAFLTQRDGGTDYRYETLDELAVLNASSFNGAPSNFTVYSRALPGYWVTNTVPGTVGAQVNLAGTAADMPDGSARWCAITNAFYLAGFSGSEAGVLYRNLIDYIDPDSDPGLDTTCVEPVPMINEMVFSNSVVFDPSALPTPTYTINCWASFELWYPFVSGGGTYSFTANVAFVSSAGPIAVGGKQNLVLSSTQQFNVASFTALCITNNDPVSFTIRVDSAAIGNSPALSIVYDELKCPCTVFTAVLPDGVNAMECLDPRFNRYPTNSGWQVEATPNTLGKTNTWTASYLLANGDMDTKMHVANTSLQSVAELGYLVYSSNAPWHTVKLYGTNLHRVLDVFAIGPNTTDPYVTNTVWRGRVNPNTRVREVLSVVFSNMPVDEYPGQAAAATLSATEISNIVVNIQANTYTNLSDVGRNFNIAAFPATATNELQKEAIFRNTCGLLSVRQNLFAIIIEAHVASGGNIPSNPVRQRAVALVWRDPYTGEMFVRSIKWLRD